MTDTESRTGKIEFHAEAWCPRPGSWTVTIGPPDNGWVNNRDNSAQVPYPYTVVQEHIRMHEAHHVACTPVPAATGIPLGDRMVEEIRVDAIAYRDGIDVNRRHDLVPASFLADVDDKLTPRTAASYVLQFTPTYCDREALLDGRFEADPETTDDIVTMVAQCVRKIDDPAKFFELTALACEIWSDPSETRIAEYAARFDKLFPDETPKSGDGAGDGEPGDGTGEPGDGKPKAGDRIITVGPSECGTRVKAKVTTAVEEKDADGNPTGKLIWREDSGDARRVEQRINEELGAHGMAEMREAIALHERKGTFKGQGARDRAIMRRTVPRLKVVSSRLQKAEVMRMVLPGNKAAFVGQPRRAARHGEEVIDPVRLYTDKRAFGTPARGGSVAIDVSGSMSWDWEALRVAVRDMPGATIMLYGETGGCLGRGYYGTIAIIAERGKWIDPKMAQARAGFSGGNGVDIEAYEWLARQKGPRIVLGDHGVSGGRVALAGFDTRGYSAAWPEIVNIARPARICRTMSVPAAIEYLRNGGNPRTRGVMGPDTVEFSTKSNIT